MQPAQRSHWYQVLVLSKRKLWMAELVQGFAIYRNKKGPRNEHAALKRTG
jgi:hypothetical protein